jgi:hypothetical protein
MCYHDREYFSMQKSGKKNVADDDYVGFSTGDHGERIGGMGEEGCEHFRSPMSLRIEADINSLSEKAIKNLARNNIFARKLLK